MNNENSGEVEDGQIESPLNDSINSNSKTCQAVAENASESLKPPNSKIFQLQMDEIGSRIRETEEKLKSLEKQVLLSGGRINKSAAPVDKEKLHEELQDLRTQREKVIEERKQCDLELKGLNDQVRKKNDACTKLQAATRYKSEARIDEAVRRLEHQMQAQQLNLREEKRIVAEIDTLKRSKRSLKEYLDLKQHVDQLRNEQKHLNSQRDACVRRISGLKAREEKLKNQLDSADVCNENEEAKIQQHEHLNTIEILKKELDDLHSERRERKAKFSKEKNDYYSAIREMKSQKQREEATRRKNEKQTMMKAVVSSRATQQLYEKEKSLCDTLISYMEKLHTSLVHLPEIQGAASIDKEPVVSLSASADFSSSSEGMFLRRNLDADDLVGIFAGVHRISRKGSRKGRRSSAKEAPRKLNLHPEVVEHLLTLGLSPPSTATDIPKVLGELHEKKEFYNNPPSSSSLLALASNDPMSPISEEATPEFPTKFEEKDASKTTDTSAQIESTAEKDEEGGAAPHDSTEQTQRNKKEAWTATGTAVEDHEKEKVPYHTSRKDLADEESTTVDAVDDQKTLIRRGKIGGEEGTWHLREAGASIKLCSEAVQQPVPFTCRCLLWNPRTLSPPIASDEILVSSVIELSFDGPSDPEYRESVEGISFTVALLHSAPDLEGYEVVIKQLIDQENNKWKELKTENTWHGSETSTVTEWLFPFAQAVCAKPAVSSFAAIWRPKSFTFSRGTAVGPELTCVVPDFPDVSVQIPQSCVPVNEDFCVTIKVQEFPSSELKGEGGLVGPCLYISGSQNVTLVVPVTIRIPLTLRKEKQELGELCPGELRILHCESMVEPHYWKDITDQLEEPPLLLDGIVQFKVRHFSGFRPTKLTRSLLQSAAGLNEFVRKLSCRHRPQHARFLTCLCKTSAPGQFGLKLFCYPQKLLYDVNQQVKKCKLHYIGEGSSHEPVCEEEISVYFPEAILFQGEDAKTTLKVVRFSNKRVVLSNWVVCLGSNSVPVVEFYDQSNELLCEVIMVLASEVLNRVIIDHEEGNDIHMVKDGVPTDCELEGLSEELAEKWEALGRRLEFNQSAIANFDEANKGLAAKAFKMLLAWKQKEGSKATYTVLYDALCHKYVKCKRLAEQFCWKKL